MSIMNIAELAKIKDATTARMISDVAKRFNLINALRADRIAGTEYKVPVVTALPAGEFRAENAGRTDQKPTLDLRTATMKFYDAGWRMDEQTAQSDSKGMQHAIGISAEAALAGCFQGIESQVIYGDDDVSGFDGLVKILKAQSRATDLEGTATGALTCCLLLNQAHISLLFGNDAQLFANNPITYGTMIGTNSLEHWGYRQPRSGYVGVDALDYKAAYLLYGADTTKGATTHLIDDDAIFDAMSKFTTDNAPTAIFMSTIARERLRATRTATNATGAPAPTPTEVGGVPIIVCDSILNTEDPEGSGS